jgi:hypothetical protein
MRQSWLISVIKKLNKKTNNKWTGIFLDARRHDLRNNKNRKYNKEMSTSEWVRTEKKNNTKIHDKKVD